jgi:hypothetical protein
VGEKLVRVRSESEIRIGAIYVYKNCFYCGDSHRFITLRSENREDTLPTGQMVTGWFISPEQHRPEESWDFSDEIKAGNLFRVDDPLLRKFEHNPYSVMAGGVKNER